MDANEVIVIQRMRRDEKRETQDVLWIDLYPHVDIRKIEWVGVEDGTEQLQECMGKLYHLRKGLAEDRCVQNFPLVIVDNPGVVALLGNEAQQASPESKQILNARLGEDNNATHGGLCLQLLP